MDSFKFREVEMINVNNGQSEPTARRNRATSPL